MWGNIAIIIFFFFSINFDTCCCFNEKFSSKYTHWHNNQIPQRNPSNRFVDSCVLWGYLQQNAPINRTDGESFSLASSFPHSSYGTLLVSQRDSLTVAFTRQLISIIQVGIAYQFSKNCVADEINTDTTLGELKCISMEIALFYNSQYYS